MEVITVRSSTTKKDLSAHEYCALRNLLRNLSALTGIPEILFECWHPSELNRAYVKSIANSTDRAELYICGIGQCILELLQLNRTTLPEEMFYVMQLALKQSKLVRRPINCNEVRKIVRAPRYWEWMSEDRRVALKWHACGCSSCAKLILRIDLQN